MSGYIEFKDRKLKFNLYGREFLRVMNPEGYDRKHEFYSFAKTIYQKNFEFVDEVIYTPGEICIRLNKHFQDKNLDVLQQIKLSGKKKVQSFKVPVFIKDTEDWESVCQLSGLNRNEIVRLLETLELSVIMFGFLPGFLYIGELPEVLHLPRKARAQKYFEPQTLALGGPYLGIYDIASPGGWYNIGTVACSISNIPNYPPMLIEPGDSIKLEFLDQQAFEELRTSQLNIQQYNGIS